MKKMNMRKQNKLALHIFILMPITLFLLICNNKIANSKSLVSTENTNDISFNTKDKYIIAQNFLDLKFDNGYYSKLVEADYFYKQGNLAKVKEIQRTIKPSFAAAEPPLPPQVDIENLSPGGKVYWRIANEGMEQGLESKIFVPLEKLTETSPDFIPGHLLLVDAYEIYEKDQEALSAIERLAELYPEQTDVLDKRIELLNKNEKYLEASIAARQFAIAYPNHSEASRYQTTADEYKQIYLKKLRGDRIATGILSTAINTVFVNSEAGVQTAVVLLSGESEAGSMLAESYKQKLTLVSHPAASGYIDSIGQKLARLMGRDEFEYEFFIVADPSPNAFALPGGKIFINTGMLQLIDSEAELAGILSHEIAHSVLSHSFQDIASKSLTSILPFGDFINADWSRDQEKQADILGTRVLATAGYSADGLYNVMAKLKQLETRRNLSESLLSTHPTSEKRMSYLEEIIQRNGYNRYGYEGVESYREFFAR